MVVAIVAGAGKVLNLRGSLGGRDGAEGSRCEAHIRRRPVGHASQKTEDDGS